jgi:prephenate dehydrogenase
LGDKGITMAKPFITIIGLGATGCAVGLALRKEPGEFEVVGHDKSQAAETEARKLNAVQRTEWNLHRAVEGCSMVILALPLPAVEETLALIAEDLAPQALVLVLNTLLQPVVESAQRALPAHARFVAAHLVSSMYAPGEPSADAFVKVACCIAAAPHTDPTALELAGDFAERMGATAHFMDPVEHDGVAAVVEQIPQVAGAALLAISTNAPGWREARQVAGARYAAATEIGGSAAQIGRGLVSNRDNVRRQLLQMQTELARWLALLDAEAPAEGPHPIEAALQELLDARSVWAQQAASGDWEKEPSPMSSSESNGMLRQLFLGNIGKRKPPTN